MTSPLAPPLWQLLDATARILLAVRRGQSTTSALESVALNLRPGTQALAFQVLRNLGRANCLRQMLARRAPPPAVDALLCTALALAWSEADAPYDGFTLVNQAVEAAKRHPATRAQANFVNACLRRFLRERDPLVTATDVDLQARWNHPPWWIKRLQKDYPVHWPTILEANNRQAPMTLRVNVARISRDDFASRLDQAGISAIPVGQHGLVLGKALAVTQIPGFADGLVSVQDAAAQLAAPLLLGPEADSAGVTHRRVLDACAAPGGKTAHLLEIGSCDVTAIEVDATRTTRIRQNLERLGLQADIQVADASTPDTWWDGSLFDAILLDAPCTASGIVRRHPDVRWLRRESDLATLAQTQAILLKALWPLVKPGGRLLYCTCSVFKAEGEDQMQTFLAHNTDASLLPSPGHLVPKFAANREGVPDNSADDHDGFFLALLEKRTA
jgi:16S rRNA (cytosine967-C5)-methyltransferase